MEEWVRDFVERVFSTMYCWAMDIGDGINTIIVYDLHTAIEDFSNWSRAQFLPEEVEEFYKQPDDVVNEAYNYFEELKDGVIYRLEDL